jgi:type II secretory pathway component PulM
MITSLTPRDRRTLMTGASAVAVILLFGKAIPTVARWQADRVALARESRDRLTEARAAASGMPGINDSLRARAARLAAMRRTLLRASTPEGAASALATIVQSSARTHGVDVQTIALHPDSTIRAELARVRVRLNAEGDVRGLSALLSALEGGSVPVSVRELVLTQADALAPPTSMETLRFDLVIETIARVTSQPDQRNPR